MIESIVKLAFMYIITRAFVELAFPAGRHLLKYVYWSALLMVIYIAIAPVVSKVASDMHKVADTYTAVKQGAQIALEGVDTISSLPDKLETIPYVGVGPSKYPPGVTLWEKIKPSSIRFAYPVAGTITQVFNGADHHGIDIACSEGSQIMASREGKVASIGFNETYGNFVIVDHGGGWSTLYAHLSKVLVKKGDRLWGNNMVIGKSGNTGISTGPHLHFEIRKGNTTIDPTNYLR